MSARSLRGLEVGCRVLLALELPWGWWLAMQPFGFRGLLHAVALAVSALALAKIDHSAASARMFSERKSSPVRFG